MVWYSLHKDGEIEKHFDNFTSNKFMPLITCPTRIAKTSKTLIDDIFYNQFDGNITSGNLTVGISDHLPQFALIPNSFLETKPKTKPGTTKIRKFKQIDLNKTKISIQLTGQHKLQTMLTNMVQTFYMYSTKYLINMHPWLKSELPSQKWNKNQNHGSMMKY